MVQVTDEPPRHVLIRWLKLNLVLISFCATAVTGCAGVLIGWGIQIGHYDSRVSALERFQSDQKAANEADATAFKAINARHEEMANLRYGDLNAAAEARRQEHDACMAAWQQDRDLTLNLKSAVDMLNQRTGWTADNLPRRK